MNTRKEYHKKWYQTNKDKIRLQHRKYYHKNKDKRKEKNKEWRKGYDFRNQNKIRERQKRWYQKNIAKIRLKKKEYRQKNQDKEKLKQKEWRERNKEYLKLKNKTYRKNNQGYFREKTKEHYQKHPEYYLKWNIKKLKKLSTPFKLPYEKYQYALITWSNTIKKKDSRTCQICGSKDKLHSHHIFEKAKYPELSLNKNNGITLCIPCHHQAHGRQLMRKIL